MAGFLENRKGYMVKMLINMDDITEWTGVNARLDVMSDG